MDTLLEPYDIPVDESDPGTADKMSDSSPFYRRWSFSNQLE